MATKVEKSTLRYRDFYCYMSLADFTAYISRDDTPGETNITISATKSAAFRNDGNQSHLPTKSSTSQAGEPINHHR